jgi:hypothetical protein
MIIPIHVHFVDEKRDELLEEYQHLQPQAQILAEDMGRFFQMNGYKLILTDIISNEAEDKRLGRVSSSHREGRAWDFRTRGLPKDFLAIVEKRYEHLYKHWAAISKESGKENLILYHNNGNGEHGHVQIRRGL